MSDLACYLVNLADDLHRWVVHGSIESGLLPEIREELQAIATRRSRLEIQSPNSGYSAAAQPTAPPVVAAPPSGAGIRR